MKRIVAEYQHDIIQLCIGNTFESSVLAFLSIVAAMNNLLTHILLELLNEVIRQ